ncbi:hemicentin-1-like isoform X3 [Oculina patagonica]
MKMAFQLFLLCSLCLYMAIEGTAPAFTAEPLNPSLVVEGNNLTLEWTYNFGSGSFRQLLFGSAKTNDIVDELDSDIVPYINSAHKGRLVVNVTESYTLITFLRVNRTDSTTYTLTISNSNRYRAKSQVEISVQYLDQPKVTPYPLNAGEGDDVTLSCNADGNPEPTISWTRNGSPMSTPGSSRITFSDNKKQLTITNVNRTDSGEHRCVASNSLGNDTSNAATLNVQYPSEITAHPRNKTRKEGQNVTLSCNATGNPTPKISWTRNGYPVDTSGNSRISFSEYSEQLTITNLIRVNSGEYRCEASNIIGNDTSNAAKLDVQSQPKIIIAHLQNTTAIEGDDVTLSCNATGNPKPTIIWSRNGSPLNIRNNSRIIFSEDNAQLTIMSVNRTDSGEYRCVANNILGNDSSIAATLVIQYQPKIASHPLSTIIKEGRNVTLSCNTDGNPVPTISWTRNGDPVDKNKNSRVSFTENKKQLTIINVNRTDSGEYRCVANNSVGNDTSNVATLDVQYPSEITAHPRNKTRKEGQNVTLSCNATGNPTPKISWTRNGYPVDTGGNSRISFSEDSEQLTITNLIRVNSGEYRCEASNIIGNDTSNAAKLDVQSQPKIIIAHLQNTTAIEGDDVTLSCNATGNPKPTIIWSRNGSPLNTRNNSRIIFSEDNAQLTIMSVNRTDRGEYRCVAGNILGNDSSIAATLVIQYQPKIASHPLSNIIKEGRNVTLSCNTDGNPVPTISWTRNGDPVDENKNSRVSFTENKKQFTIINVNRTDSGEYRCVANNSVGNDTSNVATLDVQYAPKITAQPEDTSQPEGDNVTLSCNADGSPVPTISWTRNRSPINTSDNSRISFSEDKKQLTITNVSRTDSGEYRCKASNNLGNDTSHVATLDIQYQPTITAHPHNTAAIEGDNVALSCNATGNPEPTISWSRNGSPIDIIGNSRISFTEGKSQLTITNVNRTDSGEYRCVANNSLGNDTSNAATLDVQYQPMITAHPQNTAAIEGDNVALSCNATGNPEPTISWSRNGSPIDISGNSRISFTEGKRQLNIANVNRTDSGEYRCVANDRLGNDTSNAATLDVQYPSKITAHPQSVRKTEGENVTLSCNADGNPVPGISWIKNGDPVDTKENPRIRFSDDKKLLIITNVNRTDSGEYRCVANNSLGNDTSSVATLDIQYQPKITVHPETQTKTEGDGDVTLSCDASGSPGPTISWTRSGSPVDTSNSSRIRFSEDRKQLTIVDVNKTDSGEYRCVARNKLGNATSSATLNVQYEPEITVHPQAKTKTEGDNVTLSCNATGNPVPTISWTRNGSPVDTIGNSRIRFSENKNELSITNVSRTDSGEYRCVTNNSLGNDTSNAAKLDIQLPSVAPENIRGHNTSSTSILVAWDEVPTDKQHGNILHYTVVYRELKDVTAVKKQVNSTTRKTELTQLKKYTEYSIQVLATTAKGDGPRSVPITVRTDQDKPSKAPVLTRIKVTNSTSIQVQWEPIPQEFTNGIITNYVIHFTDEKENKTGKKDYAASRLKAVINGLKQSTKYSIQVLAATAKGDGPASEPKHGTTGDPPTPPTPSDNNIRTTEVSVSFKTKLELSNGKPVRFYHMIVTSLKKGQDPGKSSDEKYIEVTRIYDDKVEGEPYITAEFANDKSRTMFPVGDGRYYSREGVTDAERKRRTSSTKYLNGNLDQGTKYAVFQRSFAEDGDYESEGFVKFTTKETKKTEDGGISITIVVLSVVVGLLVLLIVVGGTVMWRRFQRNETREILEMSPSVNLSTSELEYSNPTEPSSYNTDLIHNKPATEGQFTYEEIVKVRSNQVTNYDDVRPTTEDIYQEIGEGTHYQPLNIDCQVTYEGYVKPVSRQAPLSNP